VFNDIGINLAALVTANSSRQWTKFFQRATSLQHHFAFNRNWQLTQFVSEPYKFIYKTKIFFTIWIFP